MMSAWVADRIFHSCSHYLVHNVVWLIIYTSSTVALFAPIQSLYHIHIPENSVIPGSLPQPKNSSFYFSPPILYWILPEPVLLDVVTETSNTINENKPKTRSGCLIIPLCKLKRKITYVVWGCRCDTSYSNWPWSKRIGSKQKCLF